MYVCVCKLHLLQGTRKNISACYEDIGCFGFCHPGDEVVRSGYNGRLQDVELLFRKGVDVYARNVFGSQLQPKVRQSVCTGHFFFRACLQCKQRCMPVCALKR
jgi:hypothetical protein